MQSGPSVTLLGVCGEQTCHARHAASLYARRSASAPELTASPFDVLSQSQQRAFGRAATRYGEFMGVPAVVSSLARGGTARFDA